MCGIAGDRRTDSYPKVTCRFCANAIVARHLELYVARKSTLQDLCQVVAVSDLLKDAARTMVHASIRSEMSKHIDW